MMAIPASTAAGAVGRRRGGGRPVLDEVALAAGELAVGGRERERRVGGDLRVGEPTEPAFDGRLAPVTDRATTPLHTSSPAPSMSPPQIAWCTARSGSPAR